MQHRSGSHEATDTERAAAGGPMRLTRRGRLVVVLLSLVAVFGVFSLGRVSTQAAVSPRPPREVVVTPGETLWELAQRTAPQTDPRITVQVLMALNHLRNSQLTPGQLLLLPTATT